MADLFSNSGKNADSYTAKDIEVLEGLEPVRRRPGMYIGGTDERALHHLIAEVLDNSMDEAVAGHADWIEIEIAADDVVTIRDNGRGIPVDPHPRFPKKSALEVILTTLHSGGKFSNKAYATSGGLHGVGVSVVNALSDVFEVEVARDKTIYAQSYSRGVPLGPLKKVGPTQNRRGTSVMFHPDPQIFGKNMHFKPQTIYSLAEALGKRPCYTPKPFVGDVKLDNQGGRLEWAVAWPGDEDAEVHSYVNTVPTPQGGSHELGLRAALTRALRGYGDMTGNKKAAQIAGEDVCDGAVVFLSLFIREPQFQGQTKDRLGMPEAQKLVDGALKDQFDHWLAADPAAAKQARSRERQAILPLRGKILNVASASADKLRGNQELADLVQALGCGTGESFDEAKLRYERVIIMTDADVDGAHIASLLITFFYREMPKLIESGHLFLALPPLYRIAAGGDVVYARDDAHKDELMKTKFKNRKVEVSRFKGLGEMPPAQLKETTMDPRKRTLLRVVVPDRDHREAFEETQNLVESLMGRKPELRLAFIQEHATAVGELDI